MCSRRPRFLWIHLLDPHAPYAPPEPFASRFTGNPYLGEVAAIDLQPDLWDTLWNLGSKAAEHGLRLRARMALQRFVASAPPGRYARELSQARRYLEELDRGTVARKPPRQKGSRAAT